MKLLTLILTAVFTFAGVIDDIATINRLKKEAEEAYKAQEYQVAIHNYSLLLDSLQVQDENIRVNLAHAYRMAGDTAAAQQQYSQLLNSSTSQLKSIAYQQLGVMTSEKQQYKEALALFKASLKANPANDESRYNYELVKKLLEEQQQQQQQQQQQDQQGEDDQQQQQQQDQQGEDQQQQQQQQQGEQSEQGEEEQQSGEQGQEGEQQPEKPQEENMKEGQQQNDGKQSEEEESTSPVSQKLREMNISEEKARMILEAMRNSEMQYIQQNRRKVTQPTDRSKPDW